MDRTPAMWRFWLWAQFMWLPKPLYYRLGDKLVRLDGWRPLSYREDQRRRAEARS